MTRLEQAAKRVREAKAAWEDFQERPPAADLLGAYREAEIAWMNIALEMKRPPAADDGPNPPEDTQDAAEPPAIEAVVTEDATVSETIILDGIETEIVEAPQLAPFRGCKAADFTDTPNKD